MGLMLGLPRRIEHHKIGIVVHSPKDFPHPNQVPQIFKAQILMLQEMTEELPNFLLYQKE